MPYTDDQIEYLQSAAPGVQAAAVGKLSDSERSDLMSSLTAYKAKKNPTSRPTPAGATGEISSLSPEDYARSEARNEREGTPLEQMAGQGGALKTLPRRIFQSAAYGVGKSATDALSIPGGLTRLASLPAYALGMKTVGDAYNHFADYISPSKDIETLEAQAPKTTEGKVVSMAAKFASDTVTFGASGTPSWALPSIFSMNSASSAGNIAHQNNQDVEHPVRTAIGAITDAGLAYLGGSLLGKAPGSNLAVKAASEGVIGSAVQLAQNVVAKYTYDPKRSLHDGVVESSLMYGAGALAHGLNQRSSLRKGMETHPQGPNGFMQDMQSAMDNAEIAKHEGRLKPGAYQEIRNAWEMARNIHEKLMGSEAGKKFQAKAAAPEEFPAARKLFNRDTPPAQEEAQNAVQVGRPEEVVPREGGQGRNFPEGGQGVGQGLEGEETPSQGQAQEEGQVTRLPRELAGAKPRYNIGVEKHTPVFENDIDKALFIVAQTTPSRNDAKYMEWLQERFPDLDQDEIRDKGKEVKAEIKKLAKGNKGGGELPVPDQQPKPVPKPPVANGRKLPIISEDELGHPAIARDVTPEPVAPEGAPSPATPEENETEYQEHQNAQPRIPAASRLEVNDRVPQGGGNGKAEAIPGVEGGPENAPASGGNGVQDESAVGRLRSAKSNAIKTFTDTGESKIKPHHLTLHKGMNPRKGAEASMALGSDEILSHPDSGTLKSGTSYKQEGNTVTFGLPDAMGSLEVSLHPSKGVASFDHIHVSENIKGKGKGKDFMQEAARFINAAYPEVHTVYLEATTEDAHNIMASYPGAVRDGNDYVIPIGELANRTSHPKAEAKPNPMAKYPIVGDVYTVPIGDVHVKPKVYQFREFLHDPLAGSGPYNKQLAGEYWGWVNEKGELDLIDGHHRYKKAMAEGVKEIPVKIIQAKDASEARVSGAMKNIAQGDASPVDAARLFREAKYTREDIKAEGIPMNAGLVDSAVALNEVTPDWFELAASDDNWEKAAIVVGKNLPGQTDAQTALLNDLGEAKKTDLNPDYIKNLCDEVKSAKVSKGDEGGLFGAEDLKSNMRSRATIATALEKSLREDQSAANAGSKKKIARKLEDWKVAEGGLNTDIASAMGEETTRQAQTFRNEKNHTGEINDILDEYADRLDASKNSKESKRIESEAVTSLRTALSRNEQGGSVENPARSEGDAGLGQEVAKSEEVATPTRKTKDIKKPVPTKELTPKQALEDQNKAKIQEHVDSIDGDDAIKKAIRANLYKKGLLSQVNLTPENIKAAADKEWTNIMTRRKQQAGFIDLGGIADAFRDMKDRLFPDRGEEDPPSKSEIMNKVRQQTKKNVLPVDLKNVNLEDGINRLLAHIYLQAGGAGIDEDGQPIVGPAFFPNGNATDPSRDATKFEKFMSNFGLLSDNPAAIMEGGVDTIMNDPLFGLGQSPVSDAGFANIRKSSLHDNLTRYSENLLSPFPNVTREVESEIKPIFNRYGDLRGSQLALVEQLGVIPQIEGLKEDTAVKQGKIKKAKHELVNLIDPPAGTEPAEQTEARSEARNRITKEINKLQTGVEKNQSKIEKLVPDTPKDIRTTSRLIRYKDINKKLELERNNLDRKTEELGKKHPRVRIAVAAFQGADADTYPEWLSKAITPEEQSVAEKVRYFFDNLAGPALEREGVPTLGEMDHFMHQPNGRYLEPGENKWVGSRVRPKDYREQPLDPDSVRFQSKTDNALLWYPEIGGILDSYSNVFPDILSKRELANRWEPAVTEMRAQGQNRIADMTESYLNGQIHGTERSPILDTLTNWFYFKHLALNPSPALLHAVKQVLNPTMLGPAATAKGYAGMAPARFGASDASHLAGEAQRLWRSGQGAGQIMSSDSGVAPLSRIGKTAYSLGLGALTGRVEMFDRNLTFLSSLEFAKQNGQSDEEAMQTAMGTTLAVNFLSVDRAKSFRGPVGRAAFAFGGTPKKLSEFGRRVTNDAIRAGVKAAKGSKYGWEREPGKPWAAKGDAGQNLRKIQSAVVYALTAAALKVSDDLLDTHKLLKGQFHPGKYVDIANGLIHGHVGPVVGSVADIVPALTETANDIEKLGYVGILSELAPDILVKGAIAANSGAPSNQGQWGDTKGEQAARYLLNTPHASIVDAKEEASAARAQRTQARNWEILKHNIGLD